MKRNDIRIQKAKSLYAATNPPDFFPPKIIEDTIMKHCIACNSGHPIGDCIHLTECIYDLMKMEDFLLPHILNEIEEGPHTTRYFIILTPDRIWAPTLEQYAGSPNE